MSVIRRREGGSKSLLRRNFLRLIVAPLLSHPIWHVRIFEEPEVTAQRSHASLTIGPPSFTSGGAQSERRHDPRNRSLEAGWPPGQVAARAWEAARPGRARGSEPERVRSQSVNGRLRDEAGPRVAGDGCADGLKVEERNSEGETQPREFACADNDQRDGDRTCGDSLSEGGSQRSSSNEGEWTPESTEEDGDGTSSPDSVFGDAGDKSRPMSPSHLRRTNSVRGNRGDLLHRLQSRRSGGRGSLHSSSDSLTSLGEERSPISKIFPVIPEDHIALDFQGEPDEAIREQALSVVEEVRRSRARLYNTRRTFASEPCLATHHEELPPHPVNSRASSTDTLTSDDHPSSTETLRSNTPLPLLSPQTRRRTASATSLPPPQHSLAKSSRAISTEAISQTPTTHRRQGSYRKNTHSAPSASSESLSRAQLAPIPRQRASSASSYKRAAPHDMRCSSFEALDRPPHVVALGSSTLSLGPRDLHQERSLSIDALNTPASAVGALKRGKARSTAGLYRHNLYSLSSAKNSRADSLEWLESPSRSASIGALQLVKKRLPKSVQAINTAVGVGAAKGSLVDRVLVATEFLRERVAPAWCLSPAFKRQVVTDAVWLHAQRAGNPFKILKKFLDEELGLQLTAVQRAVWVEALVEELEQAKPGFMTKEHYRQALASPATRDTAEPTPPVIRKLMAKVNHGDRKGADRLLAVIFDPVEETVASPQEQDDPVYF